MPHPLAAPENPRAPSELDRLEREITATDAEIDNLVYDLCGITAGERKIIESQN